MQQNLQRYNRQIILPEIGHEGQQKLQNASVLIVGVGGLGSISSLYLAGAGIGRIGIVDGDVVSLTNLHRQVIYTIQDLNKPKVLCAKERLLALNDEIQIDAYNCFLNSTNINEIARSYDIIIDGLDNFETRHLVDEYCNETQKPYIYGAIGDYFGYVGVRHYKGSQRLIDFHNNRNMERNTTGVFGVLPAIIGSLQANEVIKIITETGEVLSDKLLHYDIRTNEQIIFS